ncbi:ankyrin repeat domain-containing protein [Wolbachia endosymbiont of Mansonella perstans]|uniref:ankyrin repeat domain-containing protein n=1 Tax=Wolbachia endosymbiont of Mansonella perstans TaxID=229526 RepID=UPI001CE20939|nr:ankyrin repeat domain-containing protein [Wolbachia endosymbiont of Mansonella perstans]MCA4774100.1 ankyrin repeat domain-containing protein [Wolbachia endosymbiont of Mansonella perstans]
MEVEAAIKRGVIFHSNTLLHQGVISNNIGAIETLLKYGANPLIKNEKVKFH